MICRTRNHPLSRLRFWGHGHGSLGETVLGIIQGTAGMHYAAKLLSSGSPLRRGLHAPLGELALAGDDQGTTSRMLAKLWGRRLKLCSRRAPSLGCDGRWQTLPLSAHFYLGSTTALRSV